MRLKNFTHVILALLLFAVAFAIYGASYHFVDQKTADAAAAQVAIQAKTEDAARAQEAKSQLESLGSDEDEVQQYFVATSDVVPFLSAIEATGHSFGTTVSVVSVSASPDKPHGHLTLSVSITGAFDSVLRTVGALEYSPYDISLQNLTLDTSGGAAGAASQWSAAATFIVGTSDATSTKPVAPKAPAATAPATASSTASTTTSTTTP